ncbi:helix-turn-helix transcriptional regulator [Streptomyces sp. NPDC037389]|uniref:helix-turn-helix domain-containing protein n=1 Tax=Streptomyces sp. NPDC037389 TaxID=3155369 RepID=UPI0033E97750
MVAPDLPVGARIRRYRKQRRQDVIAGLVGISPDYLSQIERGLKIPSIPVLQAIARELGVPVAALLGEEPVAAGAPEVSSAPGLVEAFLGIGLRHAGACAGPADLRERVEGAWRSWQTSPTRFTDAAAVLPHLIGDVEQSLRAHRVGSDAKARRETSGVAADLCFLLRSYLRRTGRTDLCLLAADRGLRAAEDSDDPIRIAAAEWNLGHALLASGEPDGAEQVVMRAIGELSAGRGNDPERIAMVGALHLARRSRRHDAGTGGVPGSGSGGMPVRRR